MNESESVQATKSEHANRRATLSLEASRDPDALLPITTVSALVGLGKTLIYDRVKKETFPAPVRLSTRCSRWRAGAVRAWLAQQAQGVAQ